MSKARAAGISKSIVACAAALGLAGYVFVYAAGRAGPPIRSDGFSYYVYLPSWFIFHDPTLAATARDCCGGEFPSYTAIIRWPGTRRWVNAHPMGVAVMQAPLFIAAHALTRWTNLSADGFTLYYQHAAGLSGLVWAIAGLWVLRRLLLRHFTDGVTAAALATLFFGTNLFHYATYDSSYSHAYSFFLFAAFLDLTERWHRHPAIGRSVLVGIVAGMIVLTRHTNALFLLCFALYGEDLRAWVLGPRGWGIGPKSPAPAPGDRGPATHPGHAELRRRRRLLAVILLVTAIVVSPQLLMYQQATGRLIVSPYGSMGFNLTKPRIAAVLFGVQKGLFFWSPVLAAGIAGLLWLLRSRHSARAFVLPGLIVLGLDTYLIASWWDWQFGGSFGHRGFVDAFPIFAIGLAGFYAWASGRAATRALAGAVAALTIALSMFQMLQYWNRLLPYSDITWRQYRALFLTWR